MIWMKVEGVELKLLPIYNVELCDTTVNQLEQHSLKYNARYWNLSRVVPYLCEYVPKSSQILPTRSPQDQYNFPNKFLDHFLRIFSFFSHHARSNSIEELQSSVPVDVAVDNVLQTVDFTAPTELNYHLHDTGCNGDDCLFVKNWDWLQFDVCWTSVGVRHELMVKLLVRDCTTV